MHVPPHFQFTLGRFDAWRWMCSALVFSAVIVWAAWVFMGPEGIGGVAFASGTVLLFCAAAVARGLARQQTLNLQWDTQAWYLASASGGAPVRGRVDLAVDLGGWMLLRFRPEGRSVLSCAVWLPAQRGGSEARWHSLRLTLTGAQVVVDPLDSLP